MPTMMMPGSAQPAPKRYAVWFESPTLASAYEFGTAAEAAAWMRKLHASYGDITFSITVDRTNGGVVERSGMPSAKTPEWARLAAEGRPAAPGPAPAPVPAPGASAPPSATPRPSRRARYLIAGGVALATLAVAGVFFMVGRD